MTTFIPVTYHKRRYPPTIISQIYEIAANFGKESIPSHDRYSLHTEYSFTKRNVSIDFTKKYPRIAESNYRGIPLLWADTEWAMEFVDFIKDITYGQPDPEVIEIHPPFMDVCESIDKFLDIYSPFEEKIRKLYPDTTICLENRSGSQYTKSKFLISTIDSLTETMTKVNERGLNLKMAVDYPQLFTAYDMEPRDVSMDWFEKEHEKLTPFKRMISSVHLWGKLRNPKGRLVAHSGDLNTLFDMDEERKNRLLNLINDFYDDGICRYFVPEVNSSDSDLQSIMDDCVKAGMMFTGEFYF